MEATLLEPAQLARAVCSRGTTAIVTDPHEIANVMGLAGMEAMLLENAGARLEATELTGWGSAST
ncbi:hypothetical protein DFAR_30006 [Desulfarculales bacterium]